MNELEAKLDQIAGLRKQPGGCTLDRRGDPAQPPACVRIQINRQMSSHVNNDLIEPRGGDVAAATTDSRSREVEAPIKLIEPTPLEAPLAPPPQAPWPGARHKVSSASSVAEHIEQEAVRAVHAERHRIAHGNVSFHNASEVLREDSHATLAQIYNAS
jgi:hypothetical protein